MIKQRLDLRRLRRVSIVAGLMVAAISGGAVLAQHAHNAEGQAATVPDASDIPDRGAATSKALLESMASVLSKPSGPPQEWLSFQPPANRELAKTDLQLTLQMGNKAKETADLVEAKIGKTEAGMVRSMQSGITLGPELELRNSISEMATDGKVDWGKVTITDEGDKAHARVANSQTKILMIKVGDKWYLGEGEGPGQDTLAKEMDGVKTSTEKSVKMLDDLQAKVNSGAVNKKNFIQEYSNMINAMYSP